jgi:hypothetical protein
MLENGTYLPSAIGYILGPVLLTLGAVEDEISEITLMESLGMRGINSLSSLAKTN